LIDEIRLILIKFALHIAKKKKVLQFFLVLGIDQKKFLVILILNDFEKKLKCF